MCFTINSTKFSHHIIGFRILGKFLIGKCYYTRVVRSAIHVRSKLFQQSVSAICSNKVLYVITYKSINNFPGRPRNWVIKQHIAKDYDVAILLKQTNLRCHNAYKTLRSTCSRAVAAREGRWGSCNCKLLFQLWCSILNNNAVLWSTRIFFSLELLLFLSL